MVREEWKECGVVKGDGKGEKSEGVKCSEMMTKEEQRTVVLMVRIQKFRTRGSS